MLNNKTYPQHVLLIVFTVFATAGILLPTGCRSSHFRSELALALSQYPATVSFAAVAPFQWSSVEIYGPYTSADHLSPVAAHGSGIRSRRALAGGDAHHLVVFIQNDAVIHHELLPRSIADFHLAAGRVSLSRSEANFAVSYSTDAGGFSRITLFVIR